MDRVPLKKRTFLLATLLSLLAHLLLVVGGSDLGSLTLSRPLLDPPVLSVAITTERPAAQGPAPRAAVPANHGPRSPSESEDPDLPDPEPEQIAADPLPEAHSIAEAAVSHEETADEETSPIAPIPPAPPKREPTEFLTALREKLTYRVRILGVPLGSATLEASREDGDLRLTARMEGGQALGAMFRLAEYAETRLLKGRYLIARLRQEEGDFVSDTGFTLCFPEKKVVWADRLRNLGGSMELHDEGVTDLLAGFYLLRQRSLTAGETVTMNLFDRTEVARTAVEVMGKERLVLPGDREIETIVVRPHLQIAGMLRDGELRIWLSDDEKKVPVKVEATVFWGKVTLELVAAEVTFPPRTP